MAVDRCQDYLDALEEELRKILVFQRELPLSVQLISQAIESCRQQMAVENSGGPSESDGTSTGGLIFEEFIPIRRDLDKTISGGNCEEDADRSHVCQHDKPDWLKSVQLWNQEVETSPKEYHHPSPSRTKNTSDPALSAAATADPPAAEAYQSSRNKKDAETKGCQPQRKSRRCWSPELHRRFLHALQELGGSHATPKQIRELMKVDDLTNDEVKSHLQKHRLHTRRLPGQPAPGPNPQPAQFVVVSGIWVASDYTAMASSAQASEAAATAIFTPLTTTCMSPPAIPVNKQPQHRSPAGLSRGADSSSSATSSHITCFPAV